MHCPPLHVPPWQLWPHRPQFAPSFDVSTHEDPHIVVGAVHWHWPVTQCRDAPHAIPHPPQLALSLVRSEQTLEQFV
jgi:hypothetical protein